MRPCLLRILPLDKASDGSLCGSRGHKLIFLTACAEKWVAPLPLFGALKLDCHDRRRVGELTRLWIEEGWLWADGTIENKEVKRISGDFPNTNEFHVSGDFEDCHIKDTRASLWWAYPAQLIGATILVHPGAFREARILW